MTRNWLISELVVLVKVLLDVLIVSEVVHLLRSPIVLSPINQVFIPAIVSHSSDDFFRFLILNIRISQRPTQELVPGVSGKQTLPYIEGSWFLGLFAFPNTLFSAD